MCWRAGKQQPRKPSRAGYSASGKNTGPCRHWRSSCWLPPTLMPALRHENDLAAVVTAMRARPDFVISANTAHWNAELAARTELRIVSLQAFLAGLAPAAPEE